MGWWADRKTRHLDRKTNTDDITVTADANPSTPVDIPGVESIQTYRGLTFKITFGACLYNNTAGKGTRVTLLEDGVVVDRLSFNPGSASGFGTSSRVCERSGLTLGAHTYKLQVQTTGTGTGHISHADGSGSTAGAATYMDIEEIVS